MTNETGLDLLGAGKLAKAIPQKAWLQIVDLACTTFRSAIAPFTATTSGIGRLIEAKFDRLVDAEKVLASEVMNRAKDKALASKKQPNGGAKAAVVITAIEAAAVETDVVMRELWANLLAKEIINGAVHPEFARILGRLSASDAQLLSKISQSEEPTSAKLLQAIANFAATLHPVGAVLTAGDKPNTTFTHEHLMHLNLIAHSGSRWRLTPTGEAFIEAVSDTWD